MQVNVHEAKSQLSKLIEAVLAGEEVIIARNGTPVVKLVAVAEKRKVIFGIIPELIGTVVPDFLEPMTEEELQEWE